MVRGKKRCNVTVTCSLRVHKDSNTRHARAHANVGFRDELAMSSSQRVSSCLDKNGAHMHLPLGGSGGRHPLQGPPDHHRRRRHQGGQSLRAWLRAGTPLPFTLVLFAKQLISFYQIEVAGRPFTREEAAELVGEMERELPYARLLYMSQCSGDSGGDEFPSLTGVPDNSLALPTVICCDAASGRVRGVGPRGRGCERRRGRRRSSGGVPPGGGRAPHRGPRRGQPRRRLRHQGPPLQLLHQRRPASVPHDWSPSSLHPKSSPSIAVDLQRSGWCSCGDSPQPPWPRTRTRTRCLPPPPCPLSPHPFHDHLCVRRWGSGRWGRWRRWRCRRRRRRPSSSAPPPLSDSFCLGAIVFGLNCCIGLGGTQDNSQRMDTPHLTPNVDRGGGEGRLPMQWLSERSYLQCGNRKQSQTDL